MYRFVCNANKKCCIRVKGATAITCKHAKKLLIHVVIGYRKFIYIKKLLSLDAVLGNHNVYPRLKPFSPKPQLK